MRRSRQVIRLLGLLKALQQGEHLHVEQLAARFHVRRETVYRDIRALEELGFPICDIHGIKSRPDLPPDFSTQAVSIPFSPSELLAIAFAASAVIRFSSKVAPYILERIWHPTQELIELRNGDLKLRFRAGGAIEITRWVLSWGSDATVLQPKVLRQQVADHLQAAAGLYRRRCDLRCHSQCVCLR